jgi:transcriptional regulator with XRE-family HTH domain
MGIRKYIREELGLTYEQMSFVCGISLSRMNAMENRKQKVPRKVEEIYLLYYAHTNKNGLMKLEGFQEVHLEINKTLFEKIDFKIRGLKLKEYTYQIKYDNLEKKYQQAIKAIKGFEFLKTIAENGSIELKERIELTATIHQRKTQLHLFKRLIKAKTQLAWVIAEIAALEELKGKDYSG